MNTPTVLDQRLPAAVVHPVCLDPAELAAPLAQRPAVAALVRACWPERMQVPDHQRRGRAAAIDAGLASEDRMAQDLALLLAADQAIGERRHELAAVRLELLGHRLGDAAADPWSMACDHVRCKLALRQGEVVTAWQLHVRCAQRAAGMPAVQDALRELEVRIRLVRQDWEGCEAALSALETNAGNPSGIGRRALLWRAWALIEQGRAEEALAAIAAHGEADWSYLLRLTAQAQLHRWHTVDRILANPPAGSDPANDGLLLAHIGLVRYLQGRYDDVRSAVDRLGRSDLVAAGFRTTLSLALHLALANGEAAQARRLLLRLDANGDHGAFRLEWVRLLRLEGDDRGAAAHFAGLVASGRPRYVAWRLDWAHELGPADQVAWWWPQLDAASDASVASVASGSACPAGRSTSAAAEPARSVAPVLVGEDPAMATVRERIALFAARTEPVLITGETGTGKEVVARQLHTASPRRAGPWVSLNCAAIPASLAEAELFGHVRGAFTGAQRSRRGAIASAAGGTLFLDEIASMPMSLQGVLLRLLETGDYRPVGGDRSERLQARIVVASNEDLQTCAREGRLRDDLLFRLQRLTIDLPPLRQRTGDIPALARHFLLRLGYAEPPRLDDRLVAHWRRALWPGNVRELRNEVERMAILHGDQTSLTLEQAQVGAPGRAASPSPTAPVVGLTARRREEILELARAQGHITRKQIIATVGCAPVTAQRDLAALVAAGALQRVRHQGNPRFDYFVPTARDAAARG